jgi:phosphohistidine phosphatase
LREKFPTAALARFKFDGPWAELGAGAARLSHFLRPKDLG